MQKIIELWEKLSGEYSMKKTAVDKCYKRFYDWRTSPKDGAQLGQPAVKTIEEK